MRGSHNLWAAVANESPGTALAKAQEERWAAESNDAILRKLNAKIASMLEGISAGPERQAVEQIQLTLLQKRRTVAEKFGIEWYCMDPSGRE